MVMIIERISESYDGEYFWKGLFSKVLLCALSQYRSYWYLTWLGEGTCIAEQKYISDQWAQNPL